MFHCCFPGPTRTHNDEPASDVPRDVTEKRGISKSHDVPVPILIRYLVRKGLRLLTWPNTPARPRIAKAGGIRERRRKRRTSPPAGSERTRSGFPQTLRGEYADRFGYGAKRASGIPGCRNSAPDASADEEITEMMW